MADRVFITFLGAGEYKEAVYVFGGRSAAPTRYVQTAELSLTSPERYDRVIILATDRARETHYASLENEIIGLGIPRERIVPVHLSDGFTPEDQWRWFESVLAVIGRRDSVVFDFTHGFRAFPIVLSSAISFLCRARSIEIEAVLYGVYDESPGEKDIVDMKEFYVINEWADAVSRLVEDADSSKLEQVALASSDYQAGALRNPELLSAVTSLTSSLRNAEANYVAQKAERALKLLEDSSGSSQGKTGELLAGLVVEKFAALASSPSVRYDLAYFETQLEIIKVLNTHRLYMQSFTVMMEFIGSIGMIGSGVADVHTKKGRSRFDADLFKVMIGVPEKDWTFAEAKAEAQQKLYPFYSKLDSEGVIDKLRRAHSAISNIRNGFDHAWTGKDPAKNLPDIAQKSADIEKDLEDVITRLCGMGMLQNGARP